MSMNNPRNHSSKFTLPHFFSLTSLLSVLIAILFLFVLSREASIQLITEFGEQTNTSIAGATINATESDLVNILKISNELLDDTRSELTIPTQLITAINESMRNTSVVKITIYDKNCALLYSTAPTQTDSDDKLIKLADIVSSGKTTSTLIYRDGLSFFQKPTNEDNLLQTFIPIISPDSKETLGILEIHTNVRKIVTTIEVELRRLWIALILILAILYTVLQVVVRYANKTVKHQHEIIEKRNKTLEVLSAKLLQSEERERKQIAEKLHEDIAQTLAALKLNLEHINSLKDKPEKIEYTQLSERLIPAIHQAIDDVRSMAMEIRPLSIDDIGLIPTINWMCRKFRQEHPSIIIEHNYGLEEKDIPSELTLVVYRVIEHILDEIGARKNSTAIIMDLEKGENKLSLYIDNRVAVDNMKGSSADFHTEHSLETTSIRERIYLSGGVITISTKDNSSVFYKIDWEI